MLPVKLAILHARALYNVKKNKEAVHFSIGALIEAGISQMQIVSECTESRGGGGALVQKSVFEGGGGELIFV